MNIGETIMFSTHQGVFTQIYQKLKHTPSLNLSKDELRCVMAYLIADKQKLLSQAAKIYKLQNDSELSLDDVAYEYLLNCAIAYCNDPEIVASAKSLFQSTVNQHVGQARK